MHASSSLPRPAETAESTVAAEVWRGLTAKPKTLSPWLFYDDEGSRLFEQITELDEYYLTRTERGILAAHAEEMIAAASDGGLGIFELGAGTASKSGLLLRAAVQRQGGVAYHPIDVSATALEVAKLRLETELPGVTVLPRVADYAASMEEAIAAEASSEQRKLVLYIGSSIGNFEPRDAAALLSALRRQLQPGDCLLLGVDLVKPAPILLAAYNDAAGVTAAFNLNLLTRINRELGANFNPRCFRHRAIWNPAHSRIEMHLESLVPQTVSIPALDLEVHFSRAETIHTENSYKYTPGLAEDLLSHSGFALLRQWNDDREWFGVYLAAVR